TGPPLRCRIPNVLSEAALQVFRARSRIGQFGDSLMERDAIVDKMLDAISELDLGRLHWRIRFQQGPDGPGAQLLRFDIGFPPNIRKAFRRKHENQLDT